LTGIASTASDVAGAGAAAGPEAAGVAVSGALRELGGDASIVLLFASTDLGPARAAAQAQGAAGDVPVVGLTSDACLGAPGVVRGGCVALALGRAIPAGIGVAEHAQRDPREAGRVAAAEALASLREPTRNTVLLLLVDTRSGDQADTVAGAYAVAGGTVPLAGGGAAGDRPAQIARGHAYERSVVAVALGSDEPIGIGTAHGCRAAPVAPSIVTEAEGVVIRQLDGRPAESVYLRKLGVEGRDLDDREFGTLAAAHPLAQPELSGDVRLRHVLDRDGDGGLVCATRIPVNAAVHVGEQSVESIVLGAPHAPRAACAQLGGRPPRAALVFDCAGRKHVLGSGLEAEAAGVLDGLGEAAGGTAPPTAGIYTRGEIGRLRGAKGDRNHAVVVVAFA
jgi:hypothetical protein